MLIDWIVTGVTGWPSGVPAAAMAWRTLSPKTSLPKIVKRKSRKPLLVSSGLLMKNSELLPSAPLLAMASRPLEVKQEGTQFVRDRAARAGSAGAALGNEIREDAVERGALA